MGIVSLTAWSRTSLRSLGPRNVHAARIWVTTLIAVSTVIFLGAAVFSPAGTDVVQMICGIILALLCVGLLVVPERRLASLCTVGAIVGVAAIVVLDFATSDATLTGQIFFCLPVLYAGIHLRTPGVVLVSASAAIAEIVVVVKFLPSTQALTNAAFLNGTLVLMAVVLTRATINQLRLVDKLRHQATIDPLTGLVTRRVFDEEMLRIASPGHSPAAARHAVIVIDVDRFKLVNDTFGHAVGDRALAHIACILSGRCTDGDILARMGGDEFALLMNGITHEAANHRAADLVAAVRERPLQLPDGQRINLSISAGAAHAAVSKDTQDLYTDADAALYRAKRAERGAGGGVGTTSIRRHTSIPQIIV